MVPEVVAAAITWSLVRITPSARMTAPLPEPDPADPVTNTVTTDGSAVVATLVVSHEPGGGGELDRRRGPQPAGHERDDECSADEFEPVQRGASHPPVT